MGCTAPDAVTTINILIAFLPGATLKMTYN
jgi:hypothetical protein